MTKDIFYNMSEFIWHKETKSFYAEAWNTWPDGDYNVAFPSGKEQFYIIVNLS